MKESEWIGPEEEGKGSAVLYLASFAGQHLTSTDSLLGGRILQRRLSSLALSSFRPCLSSYDASCRFKAVTVLGFAFILRQTPFSWYDSLSTWMFLRMSASTPSLP